MTNATPGPWTFYELTESRVTGKSDGLGYIRPLTAQDFDNREIAHHGDSQRSREENIANARLIAAAPDLLDALWVCTEHNALYLGENHNTVIQGRAAIAKATKS